MSGETHTIKQLLLNARKELAIISDSATLDAELLLAHCLNKSRTYLHTWPEVTPAKQQIDNFKELITKRLDDYPVAYLLGKKEFWTFELVINSDVLIPRPETELLVEIALEKIVNTKAPNILDLGTGSGAIALALASERKDAIVFASDNSAKALAVAKANADKLKLSNVSFIQSSWFNEINDTEFDLIVSNPPYIDPLDPHMQSTIRHEPQQALIAKNKGMQAIESIIDQSPKFLKAGCYLILEHGFDQSDKTLTLFRQNGYIDEKSIRDLNENWRVTLAKNQL